MGTVTSKTWDILRLIRHGGPALCNVAVTNACNAACDFCNFARGKIGARHFRWIDADLFERALDILHERGIRYVSFFGGEPLLHKHLAEMISQVVKKAEWPSTFLAEITSGRFSARLGPLTGITMAPPVGTNHVLRIATSEVDPQAGELRKKG